MGGRPRPAGHGRLCGHGVLQVVVAVIPGEPLEISGGYAFGALRGSVLCLLGGVLGSVAVFALVRRFGRELVEIFFPREKLEKLKFLQSSPKRDALFWLIFTVPGTPRTCCATSPG
ncbi:MAG: VTT domain-containing protein [Oscillospiraceae bacterium]